MTPQRIQLRRTKGWRMPANTVKVDRSSRWGNPYAVGELGIRDAAEAVRMFRRQIALTDEMIGGNAFPLSSFRIQGELAGKNLACWCKPGDPCHADVLLELANRVDCLTFKRVDEAKG